MTVSQNCSLDGCNVPAIDDIRSSTNAIEPDMRAQIVVSLKQAVPVLPSMLIWDDTGPSLFENLTQQPTYYPFHEELAILTRWADEMARQVKPGSLLLELGCGDLTKTRVLLSAFERCQRPITYYALDISERDLTRGLRRLSQVFRQSRYVQVHGLLGSYEDGMHWLATDAGDTGVPEAVKAQGVTILWVGNSLANYSRTEAGALLDGFVRSCGLRHLPCQFFLGLDSCQDLDKMGACYDLSPGSPLETLIMHGLRTANKYLGSKVFDLRKWSAHAHYELRDHTLYIYYVPTHDNRLLVDGCVQNVEDRILAITSGKWLLNDIEEMCSAAGLQISKSWWSESQDYGFHAIQPATTVTGLIAKTGILQPASRG